MSETQTEETKDAPEAVGSTVEEAASEAKPEAAKAPVPFADDDDADDSLLGEFLLFLKEEKKWWLAPLVLLLLGISAVILFAEGSAIAPFIYTVF